jgi:hypothetical protein
LSHIEIGPAVLAALAGDAEALDKELGGEIERERLRFKRAIVASTNKLSMLTDKLASGVLDDDIYREKTAELKRSETSSNWRCTRSIRSL